MSGAGTTAGRRIRWWVTGAPTPLLERLRADPDATLRSAGSVARARVGRKRFYRVEASGEPALYVKVFAPPHGVAGVASFLRPSKARREAALARAVAQRGFDVAAPLATGEERRFGWLGQSFSAIPERPGRDLRALLADPTTPRARRRALLLGFARLARRLHDAGVDQDDFSPNNFLVNPDDAFVLLDFERCRVGPPLGERRFALLAKLHRHGLGVSRTERVRFLAAYLAPAGGRAERRAAFEKIAAALRSIRARDARHAARGAFRPGRHVRREGASWVVVGREDASVVRLACGAGEARAAWVRAHQLERLGLPALRPVRLRERAIELEDPGARSPAPAKAEAEVLAALRRFQPWGRFVRPPDWHFGPRGALLRDPRAFELSV
jgi:hypothetical protein